MKSQAELDAEAKRRAARGSRLSLQTQPVGASCVPSVSEPAAQQQQQRPSGVTAVSYHSVVAEPESQQQPGGVTAVSYNYEPQEPAAQQPGVTAVSYKDEPAPAVSGWTAAVSEPMGPPVEAAVASYTQTTTMRSLVEQDAEAKLRARGGGRMSAVVQVGALSSVVEAPSAPAVQTSESAVKPGVQMVSGEDAEALDNRMRRKEERGTRSDARAERRANATSSDVTTHNKTTIPAPMIVAPVLRPGAVTVIASAAMQHAPKVDSGVSVVSSTTTHVGAVNSAGAAASGDDKEQKSLQKELTPEERAAAERQRKLDEKMAAMDREDQLRESRNRDHQELLQEKQGIAEHPIPPSDKENDTPNPTGHFAPHLLNHGNQQSMIRVGQQQDQQPFAEKGVPEKNEGFGAEHEQPISHPVVTADYGAVTAPDVIGGYFIHTPEVDDNQLAVAIAIEEDEEEKFIAAAVEYDPDSKPPMYQNRRFRVYGFCGLCCVCLAVVLVIILVVVMDPGEIAIKRQTIPPTDPPTGAPTSSSESKFRSFFSTLVGDQVFVEGTPHDLAAQWIMFEDPMKLTPDDENLLQRYLLSFLYYHTTLSGADRWRSCNPPGIAGFDGEADLDDIDATDPDKCMLYSFVRLEDDSIGYEPVPDKIRWMSSKSECEWEGVKCQGGTDVLGMEFFGQRLQGPLPTEIGELPFLQSISFPYNDFTGSIPTVYGSLRYLLNLEVHGNWLSGTIPEEFFDQTGNSLVAFNVGQNLLDGTLSTGIGNLRDLKGLHIFENNIVGRFPTEIANLGFLAYIRIYGNEFTGPIPTEVGKLGQLSEFWWDTNMFTGTLPSELGLLTRLSSLQVFGNKDITGTIPTEIYGLTRLNSLDLASMSLTGTLSTMVGLMTDLEQLRISRNQMTGTIPSEIALLTKLQLFWAHINQMVGSMPIEICSLVSPIGLAYLQTDCNPEGAAAVDCLCCTACCDRNTSVCLTRE